jgi:TolA-binding protein
MKRQQRHHLKENELVHTLEVARGYIEPRRKQLTTVATIVVVLALVAAGVFLYRQHANSEADEALAAALVAYNARVVPPSDPDVADLPESAALDNTGTFTTEAAKLRAALPRLQAVVDKYPNEEAGIVARYYLASAFATLGRSDDAVKQFEEVVKTAKKDDVYHRMARLGLADAQMRAGQVDAAIASWKQLADENNPDIPADAVLLELAKAYEAKGNTDDARKTYTQLLDQHPTSPYSTDARSGLDALKG